MLWLFLYLLYPALGVLCGGVVLWTAVRGWVQVAAETEPTLSVQVLEVSGFVCG